MDQQRSDFVLNNQVGGFAVSLLCTAVFVALFVRSQRQRRRPDRQLASARRMTVVMMLEGAIAFQVTRFLLCHVANIFSGHQYRPQSRTAKGQAAISILDW